MEIDIRPLRQQDKTDWLQLWQGYTTFYGAQLTDDITEFTWRRLLEPASPMFARVAEAGQQIAGFALCVLHDGSWVRTPICYLEDLYVAPEMRGRGIARTLMQSLMAEGREAGWSRLYWHTRADNGARRLYDEFTPADDYVRYRIAL